MKRKKDERGEKDKEGKRKKEVRRETNTLELLKKTVTIGFP